MWDKSNLSGGEDGFFSSRFLGPKTLNAVGTTTVGGNTAATAGYIVANRL